MKTAWKPFALFVVLSLAAGGIGSLFTIPAIGSWYAGLVHPSWTPPNWVFGPVWNTLYILMGLSAGFVWNSGRKGREWAIALFVLHLGVNIAWSVVFFGLEDVVSALVIIKSLWLLIVAMMIFFWRFSHRATYLLIPYLLWVTYASTLNLGIILLNP